MQALTNFVCSINMLLECVHYTTLQQYLSTKRFEISSANFDYAERKIHDWSQNNMDDP